ncbi:hypothetical protein [Flavobacterium sp. HSC-61S13]|uniref:hypothetical protein n=1 Tax=Flavobacterium sp. HSC-61S13 TaxID=2910963 RepID=UPI00209D3271|nr:hypothetical protein [Flavobacterium sp. HSC-61S13]MCP1996316.1 hypothetical protein [Flavobacterium sp. HSC-61S13]
MKVTTSEIHKNDFSAMGFYGAMNYSVKQIREAIGFYKNLRKVNTSIFGDIHALSLLSVHSNNFDIPIIQKEAEEWKEILLKYFERIQKKIPEEIREEFKQNLSKDLEIIISKGKDYPEYRWKERYYQREITLTIKNEELKDRYEKLAEEIYKGKLGNALHNYIHDCLEKLDNGGQEKLINSDATDNQKSIIFNPTYFKSNNTEFTYLLNDFNFFLNKAELENEVEINAYDIEKSINLFLADNDKSLLKHLRFDTESSLLSVQSDEIEHLITLNEYLLKIATDINLKMKYLTIGM